MPKTNLHHKLIHKHGYQKYADNCRNCEHFSTTELSDHSHLDQCNIDAEVYVDGAVNPDYQGVYELPNPWGICDDFEDKRKKR